MALITHVPEPNLWDDICKEYQAMRAPLARPDKEEIKMVNFDPSKLNPSFYGKTHTKLENTESALEDFDSSKSHPACVGYTFVESKPPATPQPPSPLPDKNSCPPGAYLEHYVFPHLLPALEAMLISAKKERCFQRKRTKFNAIDFLTEYLYKNNSNKSDDDRQEMTLFDIPFVQEHLKKHPRPPLPLSLIWTEEEACLVIQSHWRGFMVRRQPEIQELRLWQKEWREENANIRNKVEDFWADRIPANDAETTAEPVNNLPPTEATTSPAFDPLE